MYLVLPLMPLLASILFLRSKYVREYCNTIRQVLIHTAALKEGPAKHYFPDVLGRGSDVPEEIDGECVQCGIHLSPFRTLSNCGSFPLNQWDIDRYACPSYTASAVIPIYPYQAITTPPPTTR